MADVSLDELSFGGGDARGTTDDTTLLDLSAINNAALGWYKTTTAANLAQQQIQLGQPVTVIGANGMLAGSATAANTAAKGFTSFLSGTGGVILVVAILALMLMRK